MGIWGAFGLPFLCPKWSILGSGVTTGVTFLEKWGYKSGVKRITIAWVGKLPLLPLYVQETYPFSTSVFGAYTLLYIVYRGFLAYFSAFQGEGEHTRGTFWGCTIFPEPGK